MLLFNTGDEKHWSSSRVPQRNAIKSLDIEVTAYMLLSYTAFGAQNAIGNGLPVVKWLSAQRNAGGGFSSTQVPA